ncbi:MAG TPA: hypothetical protein VNN62_17900 [Methylomirabilota bacterium]|jgi:hypothetical protein|nr:hypothetical protein [Methylomirabilota bacterium]
MKNTWKKAFLMALPLAGLFFTAPVAEARKHHHHCRPYYGRGWYDRGRYDRWRPYSDDYYYSSRYPYRPYYGRRYDDPTYYDPRYERPYYGGYPWWSIFFDR